MMRVVDIEVTAETEGDLSTARERATSLRRIIGAAREASGSPQERLQMLSRWRAAASIEHLGQASLDEFKQLKLMRVPAVSVGAVICSVCTVLSLENANRLSK